jgi:hypothetical protein
MIDNLIAKICREVSFETYKINENAKTLSIIVVMKALRIERNFGKSDIELQKEFFALRGADLKKVTLNLQINVKKKEKFKFFFKDRTEIKDKEVFHDKS